MTVQEFTALYAPSVLRRLFDINGPPTSLISVDTTPHVRLDDFLSRSDRRKLKGQIGADRLSLSSGDSYRKVSDRKETVRYLSIIGNLSRVEVRGEANIRTVDYELVRDEV